MRQKYDPEKIMRRVQRARPRKLREHVNDLEDQNEAAKTLDKAKSHELRATKKEAQMHKQKLMDIEKKKQQAVEKGKRTRAKNQRSNQKKK